MLALVAVVVATVALLLPLILNQIGSPVELDVITSEDLRTGAREEFVFRESDLTAEPFTLVDYNNEPVSLSQFEGKWVVMTWIYLDCKTVCLAITAEMKQLQETFRERLGGDVQLVSLTFDPTRDTPEAMLAHAQEIRADVDGWSWLTGTQAQTDAVGESYGFAYQEVVMDEAMPMEGAADDHEDGDEHAADDHDAAEPEMAMDHDAGEAAMEMDHEVHFDHTALVIVVDPQGEEAYRYFGIGWANDLATRVEARIVGS